MISNFQLPKAEDESDRKLLADVQNEGLHVLRILEGEKCPQFCYSVGLYYTFGHPEILVMGLPPDVGHRVLNLAATRIAGGKIFGDYEKTDELIEGFECSFLPISVSQYKDYLGYAIWFYRSLKQPFPALQLVWPDKSGVFPWEEGYDERFFSLQRLLNVENEEAGM
ncbi:DUF4262 domain-containing protein [Prosthecobacter sp.]|jgi:hypothetical protein|uniref:DUF4262 domain-containing protein n=1 Tax=Prosthecobacter sp. TaxID=1965333 RepID=UPI0037C9F9BA